MTRDPKRRRQMITGHDGRLLKTHGLSRTREYRIWGTMLTRCLNSGHPTFQFYGARGVGVCQRWRDSFASFYADMGPCPAGLTLERVDVTKGYEPGNCIWADLQTQQNNRTDTRRVEFEGELYTLANLARQCGVKAATLRRRVRLGYSIEDALAPHNFTKYSSPLAAKVSTGKATPEER